MFKATRFWRENIARLGSAIDLSAIALNASINQPVFQDCVFQYNTVHYTNKTGTPSGSGTLYSDSVPVRFTDNVQFTNNTGSAIVSLEAVVEFDEPIVATFENNRGHVGGGIALYSKAYILIHKQCHLQFQNNVANLHGGGIYWESIGNHELVSSRNCFIRYEVPFLHPSKWEVSFDFIDNTAGLTGNAIYGTTLLGCLWGGRPFGNLEDPQEEFRKVFCWNSTSNIWNYGTSNCSHFIATSPGYFADENGKVKCESPYYTSVVPGNVTTLPIGMLDDRFTRVPNRSLVFSADINTTNHSIKYLAYDKVLVTGSVGDVLDYKVSTIHPRVISSKVLLTFVPCPPGFKHDKETQKCIGANYPFILTHSNLTASIVRGFWIGNTSKNGQLKVSQCSYCSLNPDLNYTNYVTLPSKKDDLEAFFCDGLNRKGILCGQCKEGYGPAVNSDQYKCVKCSTEEIRYSCILSEYLPITLALLIVIIFNISMTSGPANSFVFFAQVITTTFDVDADGLIVYMSITSTAKVFKQMYTSIYGVWNLKFFLSFDWWLFCLGPNVTTVQILALNYFASLYFFFRLTIIFSYSYTFDWISQYIIQQVLCTVALVLISTFQPYKKKLYNIIDTVMFGILASINVLTLYNMYLDSANLGLSATSFYIQIVLIFLPLFYITAYVIFYVCRANKRSLKACCFKMARKGGFKCLVDRPELDHFSFGGFMDDVDAEGRFEQNEYHGPIQPDELNRDVGDETPTPDVQFEHTSFQLPQITSITPSSSQQRERVTEPLLSHHFSFEERSTRFNSEKYGSISHDQSKIN